jgi:hypothetical protein
MMQVLGALLLTYFFSRGLRRLGLRPPSAVKLVAAHVISFGLLALLVIALRYPVGIFNFAHLYIYAFAQATWLLLDLYRAQVAFWKPPVAAKESSPTTRSAGSR